MIYQDQTPYPEPQVTKKNRKYAELLLEDYAGKVSEDTAIHLYLYQHLILKQTHPHISKILEGIAETEMRHLELLGETITLLGVKPIFGTITNNVINYFDAEYVNYNINLYDILQININSEEEAIRNYQRNIEEIKDPYIQELLRRIIKDEELHIKIFKNIQDQITPK